MRARHLFLLALLVAVVAGCGSSSKSTVKSPSSSTTMAASSTTMGMNSNTSSTTMGMHSNSGTACTPVGDMAMAKQNVDVTLKEWSITAPPSINGGMVHFALKNTGTEKHEFAVVKGTALATKANGAVDESMLMHGELVGRVTVTAGGTCDLTADLAPGTYTLMCNLVEEMSADMGGETHVHYAKGMHAKLVVTALT